MTITDERKDTVDFSNPYYTSALTIATTKDSKLTDYSELKGKAVGAKNQDGKRKTYASNRQTLRHADSIAKHNVGLHRSHCALCIRRIIFAR